MDERLITVMDGTPPQVQLRPMVAKRLEVFKKNLAEHGPEIVRGVLTSKTGKYKGYRRWPGMNGKDCHQMLQVLGLEGVKHAAGE